MTLEELIKYDDAIEVYRTGSFETLGLNIASVEKKILSFIEEEKYLKDIKKSITCIITKRELVDKVPSGIGIIISANPRITFFNLHNKLLNNDNYCREKARTIIGSNCSIKDSAIISDYNVVIGNNVVIEENVIIRENVVIGDNTVIRAGVIIGGEGFECKRNGETTFSVKHLGGVLIGHDVEIQYNSCVDKAVYPWDDTIVGDYCKIDNFVHLGHACKIGMRTMIAANAVIGGRTVIGNDCWIGITATISNGLNIGDNVRMNIGSVVTRDIESNNSVTGNFAIEHSRFIEFIKSIR